MDKLINLLQSKKLVIDSNIVKVLDKNMSLNEFLVLLYILNDEGQNFDINKISRELNINNDDVMNAFNNLLNKNLIKMNTIKDKYGIINESISLDNLYHLAISNLTEVEKDKEKDNIYAIFQQEFSGNLSPTEYELINGWLNTGISEELIIGALKEAIFNGVKSFRYIDRILYEWQKKGFTSMDDVNKDLKNKPKESYNDEIFDYDWLNDDEEWFNNK